MNSSTLVTQGITSLACGIYQKRFKVLIPLCSGTLTLVNFLYSEGFIRSFRVKARHLIVYPKYTQGFCALAKLSSGGLVTPSVNLGVFTVTLVTTNQGALTGLRFTENKGSGSVLFFVSLFNLFYLWFFFLVVTFL